MVSLSLSLNTQLSVDRVLGGLARPDRTEEISSPLLRRSLMAPWWGRWGQLYDCPWRAISPFGKKGGVTSPVRFPDVHGTWTLPSRTRMHTRAWVACDARHDRSPGAHAHSCGSCATCRIVRVVGKMRARSARGGGCASSVIWRSLGRTVGGIAPSSEATAGPRRPKREPGILRAQRRRYGGYVREMGTARDASEGERASSVVGGSRAARQAAWRHRAKRLRALDAPNASQESCEPSDGAMPAPCGHGPGLRRERVHAAQRASSRAPCWRGG